MLILRALLVLLVLCTTVTASVAAGGHEHVMGDAAHAGNDIPAADATVACCGDANDAAPVCHVWVALVPEAATIHGAQQLRRAASIGPPNRLAGTAPSSLLNPPRVG
ncbi:MAG: hypothetical protein KJ834_15615 [Alphaproteobacteria bacterium]|jgi:hypothetical protein|nr:hypothetical protein [Alphaproteobacteria bacterium]